MKSLIIDNYDSFTYNLYQMIAEVNGVLPIIIKNDQLSWEELTQLEFDNILISPGPGHPGIANDFGICKLVLEHYEGPILGICLGHQGICCTYGGKVIHAPHPMHGRISQIQHLGDILFHNIPTTFNAVRYHSLVNHSELPEELIAIAWTEDHLNMGVRHRTKPLWGVQFHPESICSEYGHQLLRNFKKITEDYSFKNSSPNEMKWNPEKMPSQKAAPNSASLHPSYTLHTKKLPVFFDPQQVFHALFAHQKNAVWLDSSKVEENSSRFSFMGGLDGPLSYLAKYHAATQALTIENTQETITRKISIFDFLNQELEKYSIKDHNLPFNFNCGFIGYFGYELKCETANIENQHASEFPDAQFLFLDQVIVFDHLEKKCYLLCLNSSAKEAENWFEQTEMAMLKSPPGFRFASSGLQKNCSPGGMTLTRDKRTYQNDIQKCLTYIKNGDSYEICLTNKLNGDFSIDAFKYYTALREVNPVCYAAFLKFDGLSIASASIERFMLINQNGHVETKPIKGTLPRGKTPTEDQALIESLQHDEKFRSENLMIVDLLRNDLGKVCQIGTVRVPSLMQVETYLTVHQLVSTISGQLNPDVTAVDCIKACFPGGSMTGAPKIRTMEIIDNLETEARGIYSGSIGYFALNGAADFNIVIRTAVITDKKISIGVGGAIVDLSDPEMEYEEMLLKAKSLLMALERYLM